MEEDKEVKENLRGLTPSIEKLLEISGSVGASIGVLHKGEVVYRHNFGVRDHAGKTAPDSDTLYGMASITKAYLCHVIAALVDRGDISWDTSVSQVIPEFNRKEQDKDKELGPGPGEDYTLLDLLTHHTGISSGNLFWSQCGPDCPSSRDALVPIMNALPAEIGFRKGFVYNNLGYSLAAEMVSRCNREKKPWYVLLRELLWEPLGITRSRTDALWREDENTSDSFTSLPNGQSLPVRSVNVDHDTIAGGQSGVKSCVNDQLIFLNEILRAYKHQHAGQVDSTPNSPFKCLRQVFKRLVSETDDVMYCCGWRSKKISTAEARESIYRKNKEETIFYQLGRNVGFHSYVGIAPHSDVCIVVLINTSPMANVNLKLGDMIMETILNRKGKLTRDYIEEEQAALVHAQNRYTRVVTALENEKVTGTQPKPLKEYCGRYYFLKDWFFIDVNSDSDGNLKMTVQGKEEQTYALAHYHHDTFTYVMTDEEEAQRGFFTSDFELYKIAFQIEGNTKTLVWPQFEGAELVFSNNIDSVDV